MYVLSHPILLKHSVILWELVVLDKLFREQSLSFFVCSSKENFEIANKLDLFPPISQKLDYPFHMIWRAEIEEQSIRDLCSQSGHVSPKGGYEDLELDAVIFTGLCLLHVAWASHTNTKKEAIAKHALKRAYPSIQKLNIVLKYSNYTRADMQSLRHREISGDNF